MSSSRHKLLTNAPEEAQKTRDEIVRTIYDRAGRIAGGAVTREAEPRPGWEERLDSVLTSPWFGFPVMFVLLGTIFWLTVVGANYPSQLLATLFAQLENGLTVIFTAVGAPDWLYGLLVLGVYRATTWVVAVMLPPMAIFFPLFTLLEDLGYLPRVAFNVDRLFRAAGAHGKQSLTMCMGFGCNAAGVTSCRIIDSPRERLIAILTNTFVPCNGRFPLIIALSLIFMGSSTAAAGMVVGIVGLGVVVTLGVSLILSRTLLKGEASSFILELPPFRPPQVKELLIRSFLDRTIFVLGRALVIAAPAGAVIWLLANSSLGGATLLAHSAQLLDPLGRFLGMDGFILMAFILALPANELVIPGILMGYLASGTLVETDSIASLGSILLAHGWTWVTALSVMIFALLHYPCGTTLFTMYRETGSLSRTAVGALLPTAVAIVVVALFNVLVRTLF